MACLQDDLANPTFFTQAVRFGSLTQRHPAADGQTELSVPYVIREFSDF